MTKIIIKTLVGITFISPFISLSANETQNNTFKVLNVTAEAPCKHIDILSKPDEIVRYYKKKPNYHGNKKCDLGLVYKGDIKGKKLTYILLQGYDTFLPLEVIDITL